MERAWDGAFDEMKPALAQDQVTVSRDRIYLVGLDGHAFLYLLHWHPSERRDCLGQ
jgi:hypothetical protein